MGYVEAFLLLGLVGIVVDKVSIKITLPLALLIRAAVFYLSYSIENPRSVMFAIVVPMTHVAYFMVMIILNSYMQKMYPKEIRGMLNSFTGVMASLGSLFYMGISKMMAYSFGSAGPLLGVCLVDIVLAIVVMICVFVFKFGDIPEKDQFIDTTNEFQFDDLQAQMFDVKDLQEESYVWRDGSFKLREKSFIWQDGSFK